MTSIDSTRYYRRVDGVVSPELHQRHILQVGCGAGSDSALKLARLGPKRLTLVDCDVVEVENLCRTAFTVDDLGRPKVEALAHHIGQANPLVEVRTLHRDILELSEHEVAALLEGVDLIIAGTDSFAAQARLNLWAMQYRIPAVFIGIHERARGGLVTWVLPGETPCYRCVARSRYEAAESGWDGELNLAGARGSAIDVAFIDAVALKLCLAILERGEDSDAGCFLGDAGGRNQVVARTDPHYRWGDVDLFDLVLSDLPKSPRPYKTELKRQVFFALDTLWLESDYLPDCPDCALLGEKRDG